MQRQLNRLRLLHLSLLLSSQDDADDNRFAVVDVLLAVEFVALMFGALGAVTVAVGDLLLLAPFSALLLAAVGLGLELELVVAVVGDTWPLQLENNGNVQFDNVILNSTRLCLIWNRFS